MKINTGIMKFAFEDESGHTFASFRFNPADPNVAQRCQEVSAYFEGQKDRKYGTIDDIVSYDRELTEKISYLLGYDVKDDLFGEISATTILPSGDLFATVALDAIVDAAKPEIEKRKKAMSEAAQRYLKKYEEKYGKK